MQVNVYEPAHKTLWDEFVRASKNGTFLFFRDYMDYHRDRFVDHSLLVTDHNGRLVSLLPANQEGPVLVSHAGLTYGGFITDDTMKAPLMLEVFQHTADHLKRHGFTTMIYKQVPHIYHRLAAEEDSYALFRCGATLYRRDLTTTMLSPLGPRLEAGRLQAIKKARAAGLTCARSEDYEQFWPVLERNVWAAHCTKPVHTLADIRRLQAFFPQNIKLFCAFLHNDILAGTLIYETFNVAHAQYTGSSDLGRSCGALDFLLFYLITEVYQQKQYFDFGVSTEDGGHYLNTGLVRFKERFGGRSVTHDFYNLNLLR